MDTTPQTWPSTPDANGRPPVLLDLLIGRYAEHAQVLMSRSSAVAKTLGAKLEGFQVVLASPLGPATLPCLLSLPDGSCHILTSHAGPWTDAETNGLLQWVIKIRSDPRTKGAPITMLTAEGIVPQRAVEIIANDFKTMLGLRAQMFLNPMEPSKNAETALQSLKFVTDIDARLDRDGLARIEALFQEKLGTVPEDWYFRGALMAMLGAVLGESVVLAYKGAWVEALSGNPAWMKQVQIGAWKVNPMGRVSKFLRDPQADPLLEFFDMSSPEQLARSAEAVQRAMGS